jgi:hypothetical protein
MPTRKKPEQEPPRAGQGSGRQSRTEPDASPRSSPPSVTGAAFWELMDRWEVPNEPALRLIAGPPLTGTGKRPRFRLTGEQAERFILLREIDRHVGAIFGTAASWLAGPNPPAFSGHTPLEHMLRNGRPGIADVLHFLELQAFKASL